MKKSVLIGASRKQKLPALVSEFSIRQRTSTPIEILHSWNLEPPEAVKPENRSRTGFSYVRFTLTDRVKEGYAAYIDSDMILRGDIDDLFSYMPGNGVPIVCTKNQSAVFVVDTSCHRFSVDGIIGEIDAGTMGYREATQLEPWGPHRIIPKEWNSLDACDEKTQLLHYTDMRKQPWVVKDNRPVCRIWNNDFRYAIAEGFISKDVVEEEISLGNVIKDILRP